MMGLMALHPNQRRLADSFIDRLERHDRVVVPSDEEWRRAGLILERYQSRFGHVEPALHVAEILIILAAERLGTELITEHGGHFRLWSRFLAQPRRPRLLAVEREPYLNSGQQLRR